MRTFASTGLLLFEAASATCADLFPTQLSGSLLTLLPPALGLALVVDQFAAGWFVRLVGGDDATVS